MGARRSAQGDTLLGDHATWDASELDEPPLAAPVFYAEHLRVAQVPDHSPLEWPASESGPPLVDVE